MPLRINSVMKPVWSNKEHSTIDLIIKLDGSSEELPFTADPNDCEEHGRAIFAAALAGEYGEIAEYVPPPPPTTEELSAQVRSQRDYLIAESDWTQLPDARAAMGAEKAAEWDVYRQALRDIPQQSGFPEQVEWPVAPSK
jgi:hypothetical protein